VSSRCFSFPVPRRAPALALTLALASCGGERGATGQAEFGGECEPGDVACENAGIDAPIAVGAVMPLHVGLDSAGSATPDLQLVAADPSVIKVSGFDLTGESAGMSAVLAVTDDDLVLDIIHVYVAEPTRIEVRRSDRADSSTIDGRMQLLVGDELPLVISAYADGGRLGGIADGDWRSSSGAVALLYDGAAGTRRLVAREPGVADVIVSAMGQETSVKVEVIE